VIAIVDNDGEYSAHELLFIDADGYSRADFDLLVPLCVRGGRWPAVVGWVESVEWRGGSDDWTSRLSNGIGKIKKSYGNKEWLALPDSAMRSLLADLEEHGGKDQLELARAIRLNLGMVK
jgi:hypothetical protein